MPPAFDSPNSGHSAQHAAQSLAEAGVAALERANHAEAIDLLTRAVAADPASAAHLNNLGLALEAAGRLEDACTCFVRTVALAPHSSTVHFNLGGVHFARGDFAQAEIAFRASLHLDPNSAATCNNLALALNNQNRREEAVEYFHRALQLQPDYAAALSNLGKTLLELDRSSAAEQSLRRALQINPQLAAAHNNLGMALLEQGDIDQAMASFQQAIAIDPDHAEAYDNWGVALRESGKPADAIALHEQARRRQPRLASAAHNLGIALAQLGRFDEAEQHFRRALEIDPRLTAAYFHLSQLRRQSLDDADVAALEASSDRSDLSPKDQSFAAFALGNVYDRRGEFDRAFARFAQANKLAARKYDPAEHEQFIDRMIGAFDAELFDRLASRGSDDERPVFIVGMPRSGTTLVEQIISSHPAAAAGGELLPLPKIAAALFGANVSGAASPDPAAPLADGDMSIAAHEYLRSLASFAGDSVRVTDKLPGNYQHLGLAAILFPRARIIHCRRHPLDTCLSCFFQHFDQSPFANHLEHLAARYRAYRRLMAHWRGVLPIRIVDIEYEALVDDIGAGARRIIDACGLPWDDRCLRPEQNERPIDTASMWQARQPVYRRSVGRWRNYRRHLRPLIDALGEEADAG